MSSPLDPAKHLAALRHTARHLLKEADALTPSQRAALFAASPGERYYAADAAFAALHDEFGDWATFDIVACALSGALRTRYGEAAILEWWALRHMLLAEAASDLMVDPSAYGLPSDHEPDPAGRMLWTRGAWKILTRPWRTIARNACE